MLRETGIKPEYSTQEKLFFKDEGGTCPREKRDDVLTIGLFVILY